MERALGRLQAEVYLVSEAHAREVANLKRAHEEEKGQLLRQISELTEKNEELESLLAACTRRLSLDRDSTVKIAQSGPVSDASHISDSEFDTSNQCKSPSVPEDNVEDDRVLPLSFGIKTEANGVKNERRLSNGLRSLRDSDAEPCEPGFNSEEFKQFLKRRRQGGDNQPNYQYVDVVRNEEARSQLEAFECADCRAFYASLNGHEGINRCARHSTPPNRGDCLRKVAGRHRATYKPPRTPPGFWDLDFPDSIERKKRQAETQTTNL